MKVFGKKTTDCRFVLQVSFQFSQINSMETGMTDITSRIFITNVK